MMELYPREVVMNFHRPALYSLDTAFYQFGVVRI